MNRREEALQDLGRYIRAQREMARISVRQLARLSNLSDSYLSQVERGLYQPSADVLKSISKGLDLEPEDLFRRMGWLVDAEHGEPGEPPSVSTAINADARLTAAEKAALIQMYRTMVSDDS